MHKKEKKLLHKHLGEIPLHSPLSWQLLVGDPESPYPVLQVYFMTSS